MTGVADHCRQSWWTNHQRLVTATPRLVEEGHEWLKVTSAAQRACREDPHERRLRNDSALLPGDMGERRDPVRVKALRVHRIVILGRGGSGKSVLARQLGDTTGLPVIELDHEFWSERLDPMPPDEWRQRQEALAAPDAWILDGDLGPYDDPGPRLARADTVIVLDLSWWLCAWRAARRSRQRKDFWIWVWRWRRDSRPQLMDAINRFAPDAELVILRSRRAITDWVASSTR
jgi:adenylate kinase family enzyme